MHGLSNISRIIADEVHEAERPINLAAQDTAQFLLTTLDATEAHDLSPAMTQRMFKATVAELNALVDGQDHITIRARSAAERVGRQLGLTRTCWGEGTPDPTTATLTEKALEPA